MTCAPYSFWLCFSPAGLVSKAWGFFLVPCGSDDTADLKLSLLSNPWPFFPKLFNLLVVTKDGGVLKVSTLLLYRLKRCSFGFGGFGYTPSEWAVLKDMVLSLRPWGVLDAAQQQRVRLAVNALMAIMASISRYQKRSLKDWCASGGGTWWNPLWLYSKIGCHVSMLVPRMLTLVLYFLGGLAPPHSNWTLPSAKHETTQKINKFLANHA